MKRFFRHRLGVIGLAMLLLTVLVAIFAPWIAPYDPYANVTITIADIYQPPSSMHWLGTDDGAKDVFSAMIYGARVSLVVGFAGALISVLVGGTIGIIAGYRSGWLGHALMRFTDFFLVLPDLALLIVLVAIVGQSLRNIILVIGLLGWTTTARLIRSQTLSVRERKYVVRAKAAGAGDWYTLRRHVIPQVLPLALANTVLVVSLAIISESTLAFLGLGDPLLISWGQMLNLGFTRGAVGAGAWWAMIPPGMAIVWVVLAVTLIGNALEDILNPKLGRHHLEPEVAVETPPPDVPVSAEVLFQVRDLSVGFEMPSGVVTAVEDVSFEVSRGRVLGLVGESGGGKTTTVLGALRLLPPNGRVLGGEVLLDGRDLTRMDDAALRELRWNRVSIVFQGAMNALNPVRTVGSQVVEAIRTHDESINQKTALTQAGELLELVGIPRRRIGSYPHELSGGMRQRSMIALALACGPDLVIADEPTTALDVMTQAQILDLLERLQRELSLAMVIVTHDLGVVNEACHDVAVMYGGKIVEKGPVARVFTEPQHPYTRLLLEAFPTLDDPGRRLASIPGAPPLLTAMPAGCRFAPRCPSAFDLCREAEPPLYETSSGVAACFLADPIAVAGARSD